MTMREITVPDIGDVKNVDVIEVAVSAGQSVEKDQTLIVVETDKATMEIPSPFAGVIKDLKLQQGDKVSQGSLILVLEESSVGAPSGTNKTAAPEAEKTIAANAAPAASVTTAIVAAPTSDREDDIRIPDIGGASGVSVIEVLVKVGDTIAKDGGLIVLETDKATMEVPSAFAGVITSLSVKVGDKVDQGTVIGRMKIAGSVGAPLGANAQAQTEKSFAAKAAPTMTAPSVSTHVVTAPMTHDQFGRGAPVPDYPVQRKAVGEKFVHASPSVRQFARELGVDLEKVSGSGPKNRILKDDVQSFVKFELNRPKPVATSGSGLPSLPDMDFSKWGDIEKQQLTRIQKVSSVNLHRNWVNIPHVTQHDDADITEMEAFRQSLKDEAEKKGVKLTPLVFVMKALVNTLKAYPTFNSSLAADGETLVLKKYWHIGVAVDTPDGLVVPVVRDVDQKSLFDLSAELAEISKKARDKKLGADAMQGSTFTISSLGGIGGTYFTPIVAWPNVAILGLSKNSTKPVWDGKQFVPRLMLPMSLSYDHRVIDGAVAARFITHLGKNLGDIRRLLL